MIDPSLQTDFILDNYDMFLERICLKYPLSIDMLRRHRDILDWELISLNEVLPWSQAIIIEFQDFLDFGNGDDETESKWINLNPAIPWSVELLEQLEDKVQWKELATLPAIYDDMRIRLRFYHRLAPYLSQMSEDAVPSGHDQSGGEEIEWLIQHIEAYNDHPELCYHTVAEIDAAESINWQVLSQNSYLPWSIELLEKYREKWDWNLLSLNDSLPWSERLIAAFQDLWEWGGLGDANEYGDRLVVWGLTSNDAIHWTEQMLHRFRDRHDWFHLSYMTQVDWSIEVLYQFQEYLEYDQVLFNDAIWSNIWQGNVAEKQVDRLIYLGELEDALCLN